MLSTGAFFTLCGVLLYYAWTLHDYWLRRLVILAAAAFAVGRFLA